MFIVLWMFKCRISVTVYSVPASARLGLCSAVLVTDKKLQMFSQQG